jgi:RNA polymerase sigma-70 factor (ECF subfamily)
MMMRNAFRESGCALALDELPAAPTVALHENGLAHQGEVGEVHVPRTDDERSITIPETSARDGLVRDATVRERRQRFEAEALAHLDALYSFALKLTRSPDEAEDLVSDTILRALERWEQYQLGTNARAWLFTILYRLFVSRRRRVDARERPLPAPNAEDGRPAFEVVGDADPEGTFYDSFVDEEVMRAIDALPEEYRTAVLLSDLHGLRYAEIAEILGIPEGTVKSRLFRGRRILQRKLVDYAREMGYIRRPADVT